jgi:hypothetical protein
MMTQRLNTIYHTIPSKVHHLLTIQIGYPTNVGVQYENKRDHFSEGLLESGCGQYGEGRQYLHASGIKGHSKYCTFWIGKWCPWSDNPNAYAETQGVSMLVEGYGAPQPIQDVSGCCCSAFGFVQILKGIVSTISDTMEGKI